MIKDKIKWNKAVEANKDDYGKCAMDVAREVMNLLDGKYEGKDFDANALISEADKNLDAGITGFRAGCIASTVAKVHSRGDYFKKSWNKSFGSDSTEGTVNPAILTFKTKEG